MLFDFLLNWAELTTTLDPTFYAKVIQSLQNADILYQTKTFHMGNGSHTTGKIGAIGERVGYEIQYSIYVKKADLEYAKHVCDIM